MINTRAENLSNFLQSPTVKKELVDKTPADELAEQSSGPGFYGKPALSVFTLVSQDRD